MTLDKKIRVMMSVEGTYPYHQGGVSNWCDTLVKNMPEVDYVIYSIIANPYVTRKFDLPDNVRLVTVPLWGTEDPSEYLAKPFSEIYKMKNDTDSQTVSERFVPLFHNLVTEIIAQDKNHANFGRALLEMHRYFESYDYKKSFNDEATWETYKQIIINYTDNRANKMAQPSVYDLIQSLGWVYRFMVVLNNPLPIVDVTHSTAAGFCGIPCILAKLERKTPFMLTEHGVYLREQYLSMSRRGYSSYLTTFLVRMIHSVVGINYAMADMVSPVCSYNTRWEKLFGVSPRSIKVIYNGVDQEVFKPGPEPKAGAGPTVVSVARVDPIKDLVSLLQSAAIVRDKIPGVKFIVYGSVSVQSYYEECLELRKQLNLDDNFIFAGHINDVPTAYRKGDIIVLSSISEAFPYSAIEAMMTGKPLVATDVGGVREAVGDCGIVVQPRRPAEMAQAMLQLLEDHELRRSLGEEGRERALNFFTIDRMLSLYLNSYLDLHKSDGTVVIPLVLPRQQLFMEKGYALMELGSWQAAIIQFTQAIQTAPGSAAVPALLLETARAYNHLGDYDRAFMCQDKAQAFIELVQKGKTAPNLDRPAGTVVIPLVLRRQQLFMEKGYILMELGSWQDAIIQFTQAIQTAPDSPAVPALLLETARAYNNLGDYDRAFMCQDKAKAFIELVQKNKTA